MQKSHQIKKLLLVGGTNGSVHLENYYNLIGDYFDDILVITNASIDFCDYEVVNFSIKNPLKIRINVNKVNKIIREFNPSIIHVHQANSFAFFSIKANKNKVPLVLTTWGSDVLILPNRSKLFKYMVKFNLKKANYITADALFMKDAIQGMVGNKDVLIANFGIKFEQNDLQKKENIIYSNRLHNELYNIDEIIRGFSEFVKINPDWKLIIGGSGTLTEELESLAESILPKESYDFIGFVSQEENKRQYLSAKIWVSVPSSDGTAISLLEAMAYGCVPVVSDLPANLEWIINNKNGIIVKGSLFKALTKAIDLPVENVQSVNRELILNKATKQVNKIKFESIYNKIIK